MLYIYIYIYILWYHVTSYNSNIYVIPRRLAGPHDISAPHDALLRLRVEDHRGILLVI